MKINHFVKMFYFYNIVFFFFLSFFDIKTQLTSWKKKNIISIYIFKIKIYSRIKIKWKLYIFYTKLKMKK